MVGRHRPTLVINPADDPRFGQEVRRAHRGGASSPDELRSALADKFPNVVVRRRELSDEADEVWYVYRDGSWQPGASSNPARDDFRSASLSLVADAERVRDIEARSAVMDESDPGLDALAAESLELTQDMATKSANQAELLREAREER